MAAVDATPSLNGKADEEFQEKLSDTSVGPAALHQGSPEGVSDDQGDQVNNVVFRLLLPSGIRIRKVESCHGYAVGAMLVRLTMGLQLH